VLGVVHGHSKREVPRVVLHYEYWPRNKVLPGHNPVYVRQRKAPLHREPQAPVVYVVRVGSTISIAEQSVRTKRVVVRAVGRRRNGKRNFAQDLRLEDALRSDQWDAHPLKLESLSQDRPRKYIAM